jgi:hypothetical protein
MLNLRKFGEVTEWAPFSAFEKLSKSTVGQQQMDIGHKFRLHLPYMQGMQTVGPAGPIQYLAVGWD